MIKLMKSCDGASGVRTAVTTATVAEILEREIDTLIGEWLTRVEKAPDLMSIQMTREDRTGHLPHLIHDVIKRLRLDIAMKAPVSKAAAEHGDLRRKQGYTVAMMVEESRLLQISIFTTLHNNVTQLEFDALLPDVVTIADEVDAQLKEQMLRFMAAEKAEKAKGKERVSERENKMPSPGHKTAKRSDTKEGDECVLLIEADPNVAEGILAELNS